MTKAPSKVLGSRDVAANLRQAIRSGQWTVGGSLPSTRVLAKQFGLSLPTMQSVLRQLEAQNLIECRPRKRAVVKDPVREGPAPTSKTAIAVIRHVIALERTSQENRVDRMLRCAEYDLQAAGYHLVTLAYNGRESAVESQVLPKIIEQLASLAGVICCSFESTRVLADELDARGLPWLTINQPDEKHDTNLVIPDMLGGGRMAGYAMARHGVGRLLLMTPDPRRGMRVMNLYTGICQGYLQAGVMPPKIDSMVSQNWSPEEGRAGVSRYLAERGAEPPQAILADEDFLATSAAQACAAHGLRVPQDVVVLGATGLDSSAHCHPSLTVLRQPLEDLGRELGQVLLQMIDAGLTRLPARRLPCELISRESFPIPEAILNEIHGGVELCGQPIDPTWHHPPTTLTAGEMPAIATPATAVNEKPEGGKETPF